MTCYHYFHSKHLVNIDQYTCKFNNPLRMKMSFRFINQQKSLIIKISILQKELQISKCIKPGSCLFQFNIQAIPMFEMNFFAT